LKAVHLCTAFFFGGNMIHTAIITDKPSRSGTQSIPDGALAGNGDVGLILGNSENGVRFFISKVDFWLGGEMFNDNGGIKSVGTFDIDVPKKLYDNYYVEQRMDSGEIFCRFSTEDSFIEILVFVSAVSRNIFFDVSFDENFNFIQTHFHPTFSDYGETKEYVYDEISAFSREFSDRNNIFNTKVVAGLKKISESKGHARFVISVDTNFDTDDFETVGLENLKSMNDCDFESAYNANKNWWKDFYGRSEFKVDDAELEMNWYASQYMLAICSRNRQFPPGLYGNFITTDHSDWKSDYHLNYNYQASFYALCSSNHIELTDCYHAPLLDFMARGRECANKYLHQGGLFYPVAIGPKGMFSEYTTNENNWERMFLGQKSNGIHATDIIIMRWYSTRNIDYAKEIYPFFKGIAEFWEEYLVLEKGKYCVLKDSIHEIPYYRTDFRPEEYKKEINDKNNLLTLGLLRMFFKCIIDISESLNVDIEKREKWQDILDNLSDFSVFHKRLKKVFRYTSSGTSWHNGNSLCIQHIYPCGQIGLSSSKKMLKISKNTLLLNNRWFDDNGTNAIFPCAARLGISPELILKRLKQNYSKFLLPNYLFLHRGGCLENNSTTANTLNEMVLQSHEGIIRLFPVWDKKINCSFKKLRAYGAFLVSSEINNGRIIKAEIFSEMGGTVLLYNPYKNVQIAIGADKYDTDDRIISIDTKPNEIVYLSERQ
jgi:alpha-L-fucosidase 2